MASPTPVPNSKAVPIEIRLDDGTVLRGIEYPADGPPLLLVHDLGDDLDAWGSLPATLVTSGFRVISIELRGHGLSDGDVGDIDVSITHQDIAGVLEQTHATFGPCGLISYGTVANAALHLGADEGAPVQALISLSPNTVVASHDSGSGQMDSSMAMTGALRALITGSGDSESHEYVRSIHSQLQGQNMWVSTGSAISGPRLLIEHRHLLEQLVMFMRRYLTGFHLAWIAEVTEKAEMAST